MKKVLLLFLFFGVTKAFNCHSQILTDLSFWEFKAVDPGYYNASFYPGTVSTPIAPLYPFLTMVLYYNQARDYWPSNLEGSPFNAFTTFDSGINYYVKAKQDFKMIYMPTISSTSWFNYPGNSSISLAPYEPYINSVSKELSNGSTEIFVPGSSLNSFSTLDPGGKYLVNAKQAILIAYTVPEPSALSLLAVGLGVVLRQRRRTV